jgi:hypothetical protein
MDGMDLSELFSQFHGGGLEEDLVSTCTLMEVVGLVSHSTCEVCRALINRLLCWLYPIHLLMFPWSHLK